MLKFEKKENEAPTECSDRFIFFFFNVSSVQSLASWRALFNLFSSAIFSFWSEDATFYIRAVSFAI